MSYLLNCPTLRNRRLHRLLLLLFTSLLALPGRTALAQDPNTFVVNRTEDFVDALPGNGLCDADPQDKVLQCTLRAAIMEANALAGAQTIFVQSGIYRLTIFGKNENDSRTGDLDLTSDLTIIGRGETQPVIDAAAIDRVLHVVKIDGTQVRLENLTLRNGDARAVNGGAGGGLLIESDSLVTVNNSVIHDNFANVGGGIHAGRGAVVTLNSIRVQNNVATNMGGGITTSSATTIRNATISGNHAGIVGVPGQGIGGGLMAGGDQPISIEQSTIANNRALNMGGGIGSVQIGTDLRLINSTVSGNSAPNAGGIEIEEPVLLQHTTIVENQGGGIRVNDPNATVVLQNSIIANNGEANCTFNFVSLVLKGDRNLIGDNSCPFVVPGTNLFNTNPQLGPLQNNRGDTETHELLPGSPAINGGNNSVCTPTDQRGLARPQGPNCDIGAFEVAP